MLDTAQLHPGHRGLLGRLMETVRTEFRTEVFLPPTDSPVFYTGVCVVGSCPVMVSHSARGLCEGHYQRWKTDTKTSPDLVFEDWLILEDANTLSRLAPRAACGISGCNRSTKANGLCNRHNETWRRHGCPDLADWIGRTLYQPPGANGQGERPCEFPPGCPRWSDGPTRGLCRSHYERWRLAGCPDLADWGQDLGRGGDPRLKLDALERHLRLEVQFGLQCRHDEAAKRTRSAPSASPST